MISLSVSVSWALADGAILRVLEERTPPPLPADAQPRYLAEELVTHRTRAYNEMHPELQTIDNSKPGCACRQLSRAAQVMEVIGLHLSLCPTPTAVPLLSHRPVYHPFLNSGNHHGRRA